MNEYNEAIDNDNSDLQTVIEEVKNEFRAMLCKRKDLIIKLGEAFERKVSNSESVCEEIKNALHEEIAQKIVSTRDIERYCLDKWKRKTGPRKEQSDKMSISEEERGDKPELLVHADGSTVTESAEDVTSSNSNNGDDVNERYNVGTRCIEGPSDIQLNEANEKSSSFTSSGPQLPEQDEIKEFARLKQDLASKSDENLILQSQLADLKSKLESSTSSDDRFIDVTFQVSFEDLRRHMNSSYKKNIGVAEVVFIAKVDLAKRDLTEIQIVDADGLESTN